MKRLFTLIALSASLALAQTSTTHTQAEIDAHRAKIEQAITARDYAAWKAEHEAFNPGDTRLSGKITAENFDKFAQMREARQKGDMATARQLREELGISGGGNGMGQGKGKGQGQGMGKGQGSQSGNCTGSGSQHRGQGKGQGKGMGRK